MPRISRTSQAREDLLDIWTWIAATTQGPPTECST
jgi:hypothetical protein